MSRFLRFAKPALVVATVWSVAWSVVGLAIGLLLGLMFGVIALPINVYVATTIGFAILGFVAGAVFAGALTLLERGAPTEELKTSRVALAGAIGGAALPFLNVLFSPAAWLAALVPVGFFALLGTGSSLLTLRLVRGPAERRLESPTATGSSD